MEKSRKKDAQQQHAIDTLQPAPNKTDVWLHTRSRLESPAISGFVRRAFWRHATAQPL